MKRLLRWPPFWAAWVFATFTPNTVEAQCINSMQFPSTIPTLDQTTTTPDTISTCSWTTHYSVVQVNFPWIYTFTVTAVASGASGYITLTDTSNNVIVHGPSPLQAAVPQAGQYRVHWTDDAACSGTSNCYTTTAVFTNFPSGCINIYQYPSAITILDETTTTPVIIDYCNYTTEYSVVQVDFPGVYTFTVSANPGYVTLTDVLNNVIAHGPSPLQASIPQAGQYRAHWTDDAACNGTIACYTTTAVFTNLRSECVNTSQHPSTITTLDQTTTTPYVISTCNYTTQYSVVQVDFPGVYTFTVSANPGYVTLTDTLNNVIVYGPSPLQASIPQAGQYRVHWTDDATCSGTSNCHTTTAVFTNFSGCVNTMQYPSGITTLDQTVIIPVIIDYCNYTTEYSMVQVDFPGVYTFTVSANPGYVTLTDALNNVIAHGPSPFQAAILQTGQYRVHWTDDLACNGTIACYTTTAVFTDFLSGCINTLLYPSAISTLDHTTSIPDTISTCSWTIDYSVVQVDAPGAYTFTATAVASGTPGYVTLTDTLNNVIAHGPSPLQTPILGTGQYRVHWTGDAVCNSTSGCYTTTAVFTSSVGGCVPPQGIMVTSANISWMASPSNPANGYEYVIKPTPGMPTGSGMPTTITSVATTGLASNTQYFVYVRAMCAGDTSLWNFTNLFTTCMAVAAPWTEDFEDPPWVPLTTYGSCWSLTPSTFGYRWRVATGSTNSANTGPSADHTTGAGKYIYTEAGSGSAGDTAEIRTPVINISGITNPALRFWKHFHGVNIDSFFVEVDTGSGFQTIYQTHGPGPQAAETDPWIEEVLSLNPFAGSTALQIRFRAISAGCCAGDLALDDISVDVGPPCFKPSAISVVSVGATDVTLDWVPSSGTTWEVAYGAPWFDPDLIIGSPNGPIGFFSVGTHPFVVTGLTTNTDYHFYVREACATVPGVNSEWGGPANTRTNCVVVAAPWAEDFEGPTFDLYHTFDPCLTTIPANSFFDYSWWLETDNTFSSNTGPSADHTTGVPGTGKYIYTEATWGSQGDVATIESPLIDISGITNPALRFWKHFHGADIDSFFVEVDTGSGSQTIYATQSDGPQTAETDPWIEEVLDLSAFAGQTIRIRFKAIHGSGWEGDMALDDISVDVGPPCFLNVSAVASNTSCHGVSDGSIAIVISGGTPGYMLLWDNGLSAGTSHSNLGVGTYQVSVTDADGCEEIFSYTITEPAELLVTVDTVGPDALTANVTGGTPPYSYLWSTIPPQTTQTATGLAPGTYTVTVTDANGCSDTVQGHIISIEELDFARHISLYPNPTAEEVFIDYDFASEVDLEVTVVSSLGQVMLTISEPNTVSGKLRLDVSEWANGVYGVLFNSGSQSNSRQLVIQK